MLGGWAGSRPPAGFTSEVGISGSERDSAQGGGEGGAAHLSKPLVLIGVAAMPNWCSIRPVAWVMNWLPAA